jgi:hypothetical protein
MKRWITITCLALISALGVLVPAGAQASTAATTKLTSGKPVKATVSKIGQQVKFSFTATKNKNATFNVTHFNFHDAQGVVQVTLDFYEPGSSSVYTSCNFTANGFCNFAPPEGGTWSITLVPYETTVGSLTLTFANNVPTHALTSGNPAPTTLKFEGQQAGYTFAATKNKNATFDVTHFSFADSEGVVQVTLYFYEPGSSSAYTSCNFTANGFCNFAPPVGGTWSVALVPYEATVGSLTLTFANNVPTKALAPGKPVNTALKFEGQQAGYTFTATKNKNATFKVTNFNFADSEGVVQVNLYFYEPGSSSVYTSCIFGANGTCSLAPPVGGTWSAALVPYEATVGSLTIERT